MDRVMNAAQAMCMVDRSIWSSTLLGAWQNTYFVYCRCCHAKTANYLTQWLSYDPPDFIQI